jgi:hypothetical protein
MLNLFIIQKVSKRFGDKFAGVVGVKRCNALHVTRSIRHDGNAANVHAKGCGSIRLGTKRIHGLEARVFVHDHEKPSVPTAIGLEWAHDVIVSGASGGTRLVPTASVVWRT